ncbi:Laccase, partial [Frankliniella fusca]
MKHFKNERLHATFKRHLRCTYEAWQGLALGLRRSLCSLGLHCLLRLCAEEPGHALLQVHGALLQAYDWKIRGAPAPLQAGTIAVVHTLGLRFLLPRLGALCPVRLHLSVREAHRLVRVHVHLAVGSAALQGHQGGGGRRSWGGGREALPLRLHDVHVGGAHAAPRQARPQEGPQQLQEARDHHVGRHQGADLGGGARRQRDGHPPQHRPLRHLRERGPAAPARQVVVPRRVRGHEVVVLVADEVREDAATADGAAVGVGQIHEVEPGRAPAAAALAVAFGGRRPRRRWRAGQGQGEHVLVQVHQGGGREHEARTGHQRGQQRRPEEPGDVAVLVPAAPGQQPAQRGLQRRGAQPQARAQVAAPGDGAGLLGLLGGLRLLRVPGQRQQPEQQRHGAQQRVSRGQPGHRQRRVAPLRREQQRGVRQRPHLHHVHVLRGLHRLQQEALISEYYVVVPSPRSVRFAAKVTVASSGTSGVSIPPPTRAHEGGRGWDVGGGGGEEDGEHITDGAGTRQSVTAAAV